MYKICTKYNIYFDLRWSEKVPILSDGLSNYLKHFTDEKEGKKLFKLDITLRVGSSNVCIFLYKEAEQTFVIPD